MRIGSAFQLVMRIFYELYSSIRYARLLKIIQIHFFLFSMLVVLFKVYYEKVRIRFSGYISPIDATLNLSLRTVNSFEIGMRT